MSYPKNGLLILSFLLLSVTSTFADKYPKNLKVDVLNYQFNIELSDTSDEIKVKMIVDVRFLGAGVDSLRLDLTKASTALDNKGMTVHQVKLGAEILDFTHEGDALKIKLPTSSRMNQRAQYTITYSGIPVTGL